MTNEASAFEKTEGLSRIACCRSLACDFQVADAASLSQGSATAQQSTVVARPSTIDAITMIDRTRGGRPSVHLFGYLTRAADGYRLISNPILDDFSQEAGYCGRSFVYFETWRSRSYAVLWDEEETNTEIVAYRVTPSLYVEKVCSVQRASRTAADN